MSGATSTSWLLTSKTKDLLELLVITLAPCPPPSGGDAVPVVVPPQLRDLYFYIGIFRSEEIRRMLIHRQLVRIPQPVLDRHRVGSRRRDGHRREHDDQPKDKRPFFVCHVNPFLPRFFFSNGEVFTTPLSESTEAMRIEDLLPGDDVQQQDREHRNAAPAISPPNPAPSAVFAGGISPRQPSAGAPCRRFRQATATYNRCIVDEGDDRVVPIGGR